MTFQADLPQSFLGLFPSLLIAMAVVAAAPAYGQPVGSPSPAPSQMPAENVASSGEGWGLRFGYQDDYRKTTLAYNTPAWWSHQSDHGWGRLDLNAELAVSYWQARRGDPDTLWQFSATPMLRWWPVDYFYTEIGVGATVLNRTSFAGRHLGTAFQFGNHIGAGFLINRSHQIGVRYSHFSNGGISQPNNGLDLYQLTYTYRY